MSWADVWLLSSKACSYGQRWYHAFFSHQEIFLQLHWTSLKNDIWNGEAFRKKIPRGTGFFTRFLIQPTKEECSAINFSWWRSIVRPSIQSATVLTKFYECNRWTNWRCNDFGRQTASHLIVAQHQWGCTLRRSTNLSVLHLILRTQENTKNSLFHAGNNPFGPYFTMTKWPNNQTHNHHQSTRKTKSIFALIKPSYNQQLWSIT